MRSAPKPMKAWILLSKAMVFFFGAPVAGFASSTTIKFENMVSFILPETLPVVDQIASRLKEDPSLVVWITGYRTLNANPSYRQILAHNRMVQAFRALTQAGIASERIKMINLGMYPKDEEVNSSPRYLTFALKANEKMQETPAQIGATSGETTTFEVTFTPNSRKLNTFDEADLANYLGQYLNQDGVRLKISTPKYDDKREVYPVAMQRLRGLVVYKLLVEKGFPATRIDLESPEDTNAKTSPDNILESNERVVTLTWTNISQPMVALPKPEPVMPVQVKPEPVKFFELSLSAGVVIPSGTMASVASGSGDFGLTVRGSLPQEWVDFGPGYAWRLGLTRSTLVPVESGLTGELNVTNVQVGVDKNKKYGNFSLFAGGVAGLHMWQGSIKETSSGTVNENQKNDVGVGLVLGATYEGLSNLIIGSEIQWTVVSGGFGGSFMVPGLIIGWRF